MPTERAHLQLALHNVDLVCVLNGIPVYHDWTTVVAFYAALHAVEALFAESSPPTHGQSHERRERLLKKERRYDEVWKHYRPLQAAATVARYLEDDGGSVNAPSPLGTFAEYMSPAQVCDGLLKHRLVRLLRSAAGLIKAASVATSLRQAVQHLSALNPPPSTPSP